MVNKELSKAVSKHLKKSNLGGSKELSPGSTGRRYEPASGVKKHNERIHKESKYMDDNKKLPFTFSKPKKSQKTKLVKCKNCGDIKRVNKNTVGVICESCKQYSGVEEINEQET